MTRTASEWVGAATGWRSLCSSRWGSHAAGLSWPLSPSRRFSDGRWLGRFSTIRLIWEQAITAAFTSPAMTFREREISVLLLHPVDRAAAVLALHHLQVVHDDQIQPLGPGQLTGPGRLNKLQLHHPAFWTRLPRNNSPETTLSDGLHVIAELCVPLYFCGNSGDSMRDRFVVASSKQTAHLRKCQAHLVHQQVHRHLPGH